MLRRLGSQSWKDRIQQNGAALNKIRSMERLEKDFYWNSNGIENLKIIRNVLWAIE